ncbi:MAG: hypothetical protein HFI09_03715 [Bacilli bacterium]|nr:hypothetical protein [Bacilli bacterium]
MKSVIMIKSRLQDYNIEPFIKETEVNSEKTREFYRQSLQEFLNTNKLNFVDLQDLIDNGFCICTFDTKANVYSPTKLSYDQVDWLYSLKSKFVQYGPFIQLINKENIQTFLTDKPLEKFYIRINEKSQRKVIIIPNEYSIKHGVFERVLIGKDRHGMGAKEFSDLHHLGLTFQNIGLEENDYNGYVWLQALSMLGHLSLQIDDLDKIAVLHIPEIITPRQLYWVNNKLQREIEGINNINACSIRRMEQDYQIKEFVSDPEHQVFALDSIINEIKIKSLLGNIKQRNVGEIHASKNK